MKREDFIKDDLVPYKGNYGIIFKKKVLVSQSLLNLMENHHVRLCWVDYHTLRYPKLILLSDAYDLCFPFPQDIEESKWKLYFTGSKENLFHFKLEY